VSTEAAPRRRRWDERLSLDALIPLLAAYFALSVLYAWQAWRRETPTIFTDELEMTQISRAIAATGHPARREQAYMFTSIVPYLTAPAWWIHSVTTAYEVIKYMQALVMALAIFPAYGIARYVVSRPWALFAAVATIAAPALSYAPILVEEPFAYPVATLALYLIIRAVARPSWRTLGLAAAGCVLAAATRSQLVAIGGAFGLCLLALAWRTERMRHWRSTWSRFDWVGAWVLALGAVFAFAAFMGRNSGEWATTTALWKSRIFDYGVWAVGALAIGCGILPLIATLAVLVRPRAEWRDTGLRAFGIVTASALASFCWYAAIKGAYLSTIFSSLVVERNLIYLYPLLFTGTAVLFERRDARWWAVLPAGAVVLYLVTSTPTKLDQFPYYEAHGLSILAFLNRELSWTSARIDTALIVVVIVAALAALVLRPLARRTEVPARWLVVLCAVLVLGWNLTTEIYAAAGEHDFSSRMAGNMVVPPDWVDRATDGGSVVTLSQQLTDPTGLWLTEFWNRSVKKVWSVDPAAPAPGPGPTLTPDVARRDGTLTPSPGTDFALALNGVFLQAPIVKQIGTTTLYRLGGAPLKLAYSQSGVSSDAGWTGRNAAYNRFRPESSAPESARIGLSRSAFCSNAPIPGGVLVRLGTLVIGKDHQPGIGEVTTQQLVRVRPCPEGAQVLLLPTPTGPWRVELTSDTFVPAEVDSRLSDRRELGIQASFGFQPS
jgi:Dolichyl-phosphate-mannose-protein mannosyltransferase